MLNTNQGVGTWKPHMVLNIMWPSPKRAREKGSSIYSCNSATTTQKHIYRSRVCCIELLGSGSTFCRNTKSGGPWGSASNWGWHQPQIEAEIVVQFEAQNKAHSASFSSLSLKLRLTPKGRNWGVVLNKRIEEPVPRATCLYTYILYHWILFRGIKYTIVHWRGLKS